MNNQIRFCAIIPAPFGIMGISTESGLLRELVYLPSSYTLIAPTSPIAKNVARQLQCYFDDPGFQFDLPLVPQGTAHQQKVWKAISSIPLGQVVTYGQIAKLIASAPRAVGQACGANFYPLIVPCHRVTAANGLGGFANQDAKSSYQLQIKRWLLTHEGVHGY
jgi:methylated-DNA-[protein]-cysteine S-methyltransferase